MIHRESHTINRPYAASPVTFTTYTTYTIYTTYTYYYIPLIPLIPLFLIVLTAHVEPVSLQDIHRRQGNPLSYLDPFLEWDEGGALPVHAEEGLPVVHDAAVVVRHTVVMHQTLVHLREIVPLRFLK